MNRQRIEGLLLRSLSHSFGNRGRATNEELLKEAWEALQYRYSFSIYNLHNWGLCRTAFDLLIDLVGENNLASLALKLPNDELITTKSAIMDYLESQKPEIIATDEQLQMIVALSQELTNAEDEIISLQNLLADSQLTHQEKEELLAQIQQKEQRIDFLSEELNATERKATDLQANLTLKTQELTQAKRFSESLQTRLETVLTEKEAKETLLTEKEAELQRTIQEGRTSTANLRREITDLQTQLNILRTTQAEQLAQINQNLQTTQQRLTAQIQTNQVQQQTIQQLATNLANSEQTLKESQETNQQSLTLISSLESQLLSKEQLIIQRETELNQERENLTSQQQTNHQLSLQLTQKEGEFQRVQYTFNQQLKELNILFDPAAINYTQPIEFTGLHNLISQALQTHQAEKVQLVEQIKQGQKDLAQEKRKRKESEANSSQESRLLKEENQTKDQRILALSADKQELLTKTANLSHSLQTEQENNQAWQILNENNEAQLTKLLTELKLSKQAKSQLEILQARTKQKRDQLLSRQTELKQQSQQDHLNYQTLIKQISTDLKACQAEIHQFKITIQHNLQADIILIEQLLADHE